MQAMGNNRARAVYEANLPPGFRRPQTDSYVGEGVDTFSLMIISFLNSALESFIRAKYEQRKWIAKEWIPPEITVPSDVSVVLLLSICLFGIRRKKDQINYQLFLLFFPVVD